MKIYPPFNVKHIKIANPNVFFDELSKTIGHGNKVLEGFITDKGFLAEKRFFHSNIARPLIRGRFELKETGHYYLLIDLNIRKAPVIFIFIFILFLLIMGIVMQNIYAIPICITTILFFYFLIWIFYIKDLKETKKEMKKIIKLAEDNKT